MKILIDKSDFRELSEEDKNGEAKEYFMEMGAVATLMKVAGVYHPNNFIEEKCCGECDEIIKAPKFFAMFEEDVSTMCYDKESGLISLIVRHEYMEEFEDFGEYKSFYVDCVFVGDTSYVYDIEEVII